MKEISEERKKKKKAGGDTNKDSNRVDEILSERE